MRRLLSRTALAAVLSATLLLVPNSSVSQTDATLVKVQRAQGVDLSPDVVWILALGSDARPGQNVLRSRADAIQLVGINSRTGAATAIGMPRDSWVSIPGHGSNRINAALYFGGPQLMAETVKGLTGVEPDYVMVASFMGLRNMVTAIGGITVNSRHAFSDPYLRPQGFKVGKQHLGGLGALAFSRVRKSLPRGDFDRSANQQETLQAIHRQVKARQDQPGFLDKGTLAVMQHMDARVPPKELFRIARAVAAVRSDRITHCVVNGSIGNIGGASVVLPYVDQARRYGNDARKDAVISHC
ncbi:MULTISPECIES: LCP family protein [unclassified Nocardioides]|uniref:LCP family protein n=1 Tax=unclassified Nocardioides TaxID=2615069 RepID=UPI0006F1EFF1|nr:MULTISPECIES: LCP family protein [unclassified Nocardioides]KQY54487.1 transcriptional regulator [Nocardioides sp. Root140]KQZ66362.1 transcriptional regulator [Nocardioides sp. Root151]KRF19563.1 transcriptional regulator [Nocardioides sp. Soil796]